MREINNQDPGVMANWYESVIQALKRENELLKRGAIPLKDAMVCLNCSQIVRMGQSCCGDLSLLSGWLKGISE